VTAPQASQPESVFMHENIPLFLNRFSLSYYKENACIEYFINKLHSDEEVSSALIFAYNPIAKDLHVSRFHPELYLRSNSKYLSAVCFYLLIHHCADAFALDSTCHISLETVPDISDRFYRKLGDFNFNVHKSGLGNVVELVSTLIRSSVDTTMITEHYYHLGEIPFMK
jgi:hypothetical protein